jgi:hypothetical protein
MKLLRVDLMYKCTIPFHLNKPCCGTRRKNHTIPDLPSGGKANLLQSSKYAVLPAELQATLGKVSDIPVDVEPIYSFEEAIR